MPLFCSKTGPKDEANKIFKEAWKTFLETHKSKLRSHIIVDISVFLVSTCVCICTNILYENIPRVRISYHIEVPLYACIQHTVYVHVYRLLLINHIEVL